MKPGFLPQAQVAAGVLALSGWVAVSPLLFGAPAAESGRPEPFPADRYAKMAAQSPFTPPTAPAVVAATPTPPPPPSFTEKLTATAIMQVGDVFHVTIVDQDNPKHIDLFSDRVDQDSQMQIVSVKWPQPPNQTNPGAPKEPPVITIRKGQERGTVRYEPGTSSGAIGVPGGMPGGMQNGMARSPMMPSVNNGVRPQIPPIPGGGGIVAGVPASAPPVNSVQRRMPIRTVPQAPPTTGAARPIVQPGAKVPLPGNPAGDDDDDDDE